MRVAGIDVHKKVLMIVIRDNGEETTEEMRQKFITTRSGLREVAAWLQTQQVEAVVMESTAQYWWPVWIELEDKFALHLVQARSNAAPHDRKTDFADARRLARRFFSQDLRYSFGAGCRTAALAPTDPHLDQFGPTDRRGDQRDGGHVGRRADQALRLPE